MVLKASEQRFWDENAGIPQTGIDLEPLLRAVRDVLQPGLHPRTVAGFLRTPQPDLVHEDQSVSPTQWLALGHPLAAVLPLARELGECI